MSIAGTIGTFGGAAGGAATTYGTGSGTRSGTSPAPGRSAAPAGAARLFAAGAVADLRRHLDTFGPLPAGLSAQGLAAELEASGLTGRGGAAFAAWRKLAATSAGGDAAAEAAGASAGRRRKGTVAIVANGAEGEPDSFKDRTLLANAPHLVIDGLLAAANALGASELYLYTNAGSLPAASAALAERSDARRIKLVEAPDSFVAGEASAVVRAIGRGPALPRDKAARLSQSGVKGLPTLVHNVETLAHIALIARFGASWFRWLGSAADPGTRLATVCGDVPAPTVYEIVGDSVLVDVLAAAGAGSGSRVLVGGFHGRWVSPDGLRLSPAGPDGEVVHPGAGVLHVLGPGRCGVEATAAMLDYLAGESAKQCGPCLFGLPALAATWRRMAAGAPDAALAAEGHRLGSLVAGRGACHHPDGSVRLSGSALAAFAGDIEAHRQGHCTATGRRLG
ncbi:NADH-ubiquinone oxidoreductase-F iron-sulfur binding region domain-containing protein [Arthrobacter sp. 35W]|uniref:NADH-ubiquinone oxidoreductase-F iron-sulfur binding region domain-containing protein n=1 Tax=Arthrobacter sp. 35W TaxID=1132441 RepID=UPI0003F782CD|nr:NADH-ubiquinone oxidoreductase-F iron-sulfur binding region domain-containing protein [Arthrobacter sp. 35W]